MFLSYLDKTIHMIIIKFTGLGDVDASLAKKEAVCAQIARTNHNATSLQQCMTDCRGSSSYFFFNPFDNNYCSCQGYHSKAGYCEFKEGSRGALYRFTRQGKRMKVEAPISGHPKSWTALITGQMFSPFSGQILIKNVQRGGQLQLTDIKSNSDGVR